MRDISQQMERLTQELRELRLQLQRTNSQTPGTGEHNRMLSQIFGATLVSDLTEVMNQLAHFLWRYIDSAAGATTEVDFALQSKRLEQATEMLRRLHFAASPNYAEEPAAFVARVTKVVDRLLESPGSALTQEAPSRDDNVVRLERSA